MNYDKIIIVRTKIVQIYLHELNHGLLRSLDEDKKIDFFNNSKSKKPKKNYKLISCSKYSYSILPADESGNYFDSRFYCGYYLDIIDINLAKLFVNINEFKTKKDYEKKLISIINQVNPNLNDNIFKFKKNYSTDFPQCAFSRMRMSQLGIKQFKERNKFEEILSDDNSEKEEDMNDSMKK